MILELSTILSENFALKVKIENTHCVNVDTRKFESPMLTLEGSEWALDKIEAALNSLDIYCVTDLRWALVGVREGCSKLVVDDFRLENDVPALMVHELNEIVINDMAIICGELKKLCSTRRVA